MNWMGLNQIDAILGIIDGVAGIINIGATFQEQLDHKNKKQFMEKLEKERIPAQRENARVCRICKGNLKTCITLLEQANNKLLEKVSGQEGAL